MKSSEIFNIIDKIANEPKRKVKEDILSQYRSDSELIKVMDYSYNPLRQYYFGAVKLKELMHLTTSNIGTDIDNLRDFDSTTWNLLDNLHERKITGDAAMHIVTEEFKKLNFKSRLLFWRILKKDLRCGITEVTINKIFGKIIAEFPYMRCSLPDKSNIKKWDWSEGHYSQEKADGMFANVNHFSDGSVAIYSRQGSMFFNEKPFENIINVVKKNFKTNTQTHGELLVVKDGVILPRTTGNGLLNSLLNDGELPPGHGIIIKVWDQITFDDLNAGKSKTTYEERFNDLWNQLPNRFSFAALDVFMIESKIVKSLKEANEHASKMILAGKEGTIVKNKNAIWKDGTSKDQVKFKVEIDVDLEIKALNPGEGKYAKLFGSVNCQSSCGKLEVNVSGFDDDTRQFILDNFANLCNTVMTVRANAVMTPTENNPKYSLFLPRYVELRKDKKKADSLNEIIDQFNNAFKI